MNDSREISEREVKLPVSAAPSSPMVRDIARELESERKAHDQTISDYGARVLELEAALREVERLKATVQVLVSKLAHERSEVVKLTGMIADARLAFGEINRRAVVLANTVDELRQMMNQ